MASASAAQNIANTREIPIVLDPVGCGFTAARLIATDNILRSGGISLVKGNWSEIVALATGYSGPRGVDSEDGVPIEQLIIELSNRLASAIVVTGETDISCFEGHVNTTYRGHEMMKRVIGMGCVVGAVAALMLSITEDTLMAATAAVTINGIAGEIAAKGAEHPGSFQSSFLDALSSLPELLATHYVF